MRMLRASTTATRPPEKSGTGSVGEWEKTPLGKIMRMVGTGERLGTAATLRPLAGVIDPTMEARLPHGKGAAGDVYAGDVINALWPPGKYVSPWEKFARAAGGMALGGAVDPLTYVGLVPLKAEAQGVRTALTVAGKRVLPKAAEASLFKGLSALQRGHVAEEALSRVGARQVGGFWDKLVTGTAQRFHFNIGLDPYLFRTHQELLSKITGARRLHGDMVIDELEPMLQETAKRWADHLGMDPYDAYQRLGSAVTEALGMHPYIEIARDLEIRNMVFRVGAVKGPYEKARVALINNFGLPPSFGGPASPTDNELIRRTREIVVKRKRMNAQFLVDEREKLGRELRLMTHPDAGYSASIMSRQAFKVVYDNWEKVKGVSWSRGFGRRGQTRAPSTDLVHEIARSFRMVDPVTLESMKTAGLLEPIQMKVLRRGRSRIRTVDPYQVLSESLGRPMTPAARKVAKELVDRKLLSLNASDTNYAGMLIPAMPTVEANRWVHANGWGKLIPPGSVEHFFLEDPIKIDVARGIRSDRAILSKEWFDDLQAKGIVRKADDASVPAEWVTVPAIPEMEGLKIGPDEARFLRRYYEADVNIGPSLRGFLKVFSAANVGYRAWTLAIFGPYHAKNFIGGMWNYWLASEDQLEAVGNIVRSKTAWDAIRKGGAVSDAWKLRGVVNPITGKEWTAKQIWKEVAARDGWGVGVVSSDDPLTMERGIAYARKYGLDNPERELLKGARADWVANGRKGRPYIGPPSPEIAERLKLGFLGQHPWIERGFRVGSYVDDRIRMSHVLQRLREGATIDQAVESTKKIFFDYHRLSPTERHLRELFPFYSWSRNNLPFQLEMLIRRPDRIARFHGGLQTWEGSEQQPPDEQYVSTWMKKNFPLRIKKDPRSGKWLYFAFRSWLPLADVHDAFYAMDWLTSSMTPVAKLPYELITNINTMNDRKIDEMSSILHGERTRMLTGKGVGIPGRGVMVPNKVAHVIRSLRLTNTVHQLLDNPQEVGYMAQLGRLVVGRVYPLDAARGQLEFTIELEKMRDSMRRTVRRAALKGEFGSVERAQNLYVKRREKLLRERGMLGEGD